MAHWGGVSVEGEIGVLGSLESGGGEQEDGHGVEGAISHDQLLTDPEQAVEFVKDTHVDALAVAMGTSHGAYKFSRKPDGAVLAMNVIEEIHRRLPNMHLVMHGSSSVPEDLQEIINKYGGQMKPTWGVPVEEIQRGIKHGVRKINIDTDNRMALTGAIRKVLTENPSGVRSAQISDAGHGRDAQAVQGALRAVRHRRQRRRRSSRCRSLKWPSATSRAASIRSLAEAPISPLVGEMPGRAEGGVEGTPTLLTLHWRTA